MPHPSNVEAFQRKPTTPGTSRGCGSFPGRLQAKPQRCLAGQQLDTGTVATLSRSELDCFLSKERTDQKKISLCLLNKASCLSKTLLIHSSLKENNSLYTHILCCFMLLSLIDSKRQIARVPHTYWAARRTADRQEVDAERRHLSSPAGSVRSRFGNIVTSRKALVSTSFLLLVAMHLLLLAWHLFLVASCYY